MAVDVRWLLFYLFLFPSEVLVADTSQTNEKLEGHTSEGRRDSSSEQAFEEFKVFLDFKQHQDEFKAWRRARTEEVAKFNAWLFPTHTSESPDRAYLPSAPVNKINLIGLRLAYLKNFFSHNPITTAKSFLQKRLQQHRDYPTEILPGVALSYVTDVCVIIILLLFIYGWVREGMWGVVKLPWKILESTVVGIAHAILGDKIMESPGQRGEIPLLSESEGGPTIKTHGVAFPMQMLYRLDWIQLSPGQKYILEEVLNVNEDKWRSIQGELKAVNWDKDSPTEDFYDLTRHQQKCLRALGFSRSSWDLEDPENLRIHEKMWKNMSGYEKQEAIAAGIEASDDNPEAWDWREASIFKKEFDTLDGKTQVHLRNMGFLRDLWKARAEPRVPSHLERRALHHSMRLVRRTIFQLVVLIQFAFVCWILYELGLFQFFWDNFFVYIVIFLIAGALILNVAKYLCFPSAQRHWSSLSNHVIVVVSHSKDIWNKVQVMLSFLGKVYREQCDKCQKGACLTCGGILRPEHSRRQYRHGHPNECECCLRPADCLQHLRVGL